MLKPRSSPMTSWAAPSPSPSQGKRWYRCLWGLRGGSRGRNIQSSKVSLKLGVWQMQGREGESESVCVCVCVCVGMRRGSRRGRSLQHPLSPRPSGSAVRMLEAGGCLLVMTCQRNWGLNCTGEGTGKPFIKPDPISLRESRQGRLLVPVLQRGRQRPEGIFQI